MTGTICVSVASTGRPASRRAALVAATAVRWPALRRRLPSSCFPEAADEAAAYHPYRYHHPLPLAELNERLTRAGFAVEGALRFLFVAKTTPSFLLPAARAAEGIAERLPLARRLGATTLIWATRP